MRTVTIDFDRITGRIKPMHCINNAPLLGTSEALFPSLAEAGIPYARLHDTGGRYGGSVFVDIENIFRDFDADPADPAAYDFAFTDWLLAALHQQGVEPFYRLGATIENSHRIKAYHIFPPRDNVRWAQICEGIIRHYTEGWANGFRYTIRYWEIWNEPDNEIASEDNPMWKGSKEQYFALYEVTANYLKGRFPHLKIGGYASCGFYAHLRRGLDGKPHASPREDYFMEFFTAFLDYITAPEHKSPLDFFSWHSYSGVRETSEYARYARETLDAYGFTAAESILNEWNPGIAHRGTLRDAAAILSMMCALQASSVDMLMYYDGQVNTSYGGMYDPLRFKPFPAYYVFKAFNALYRLQGEAANSCDDPDIYTCAAVGSQEQAWLLVNFSDTVKSVKLDIKGGTQRFTCLALDETYALEQIGEPYLPPAAVQLPAYATLLFRSVPVSR